MREVGDGAVTPLGLSDLGLGADAAPPLDEQGADEQGLREKDGEPAQDLPPVLRPQRLLPEEDDAACGQPLLGDSPMLELPPVEHELPGRLLERRYGGGGLSPEDANGEVGGPFRGDHGPLHVSAHDPVTQECLRERVHRRGRGSGHEIEDVPGDHGPAQESAR